MKALIGRQFGHLVVLEKVMRGNRVYWQCRCCRCSRILVVRNSKLVYGYQNSCRSCSHLDDLYNRVFNKWVVIGHYPRILNGHTYWRCRCECGTEKYVSDTSLKSGQSTNCGCKQRYNLIGKRFGRLICLQSFIREHKYNNHNKKGVAWYCLCDCGNTVDVLQSCLLRGTTKSCGCYNMDDARRRFTKHGLTGTKEYEAFISRRRRERKVKLDQAWTELHELAIRSYFDACTLCGITHQEHIQNWGKSLHIDHVYPLYQGYGLEPGNAILLCRSCNSVKASKMPYELSLEWQAKIAQDAESFRVAWSGGF